MLLNNKLESPYDKFAPEGSIPIISKSLVKSKLSNKFYELTSNELSELNSQNLPNNLTINSSKVNNSRTRASKYEENDQLKEIEEEITLKMGNKEKKYSEADKDLEELKSMIIKLKSDLKVSKKTFYFKISLNTYY